MSGIIGVFHLDENPVQKIDLDRMLANVSHRGPDGSSTWLRDGVGLGQNMLRTAPESALEKPPLVSEDGKTVIVADARIDNRDELQRAFKAGSPRGSQINDCGLILAAYENWGEHCVERLFGDFAFAIWDVKKRLLFCARDPFGVKPFYFHHQPGRIFAFASEINSLISLAAVPRRLNEARICDYLAGIYDDKKSTFYRDIFRLAPAHCMAVGSDKIRCSAFWCPEDCLDTKEHSDHEFVEALREKFTSAVRSRMRCDFPIGSMLSGGLDSSSVTCVADFLRPDSNHDQLHTFSSVFSAVPECDESFYIKKVLSHGNFTEHLINADEFSPLSNIERFLCQQNEPLVAAILPMEESLYGTAREHGVRIILHGNGGDSVLSHGEMQIAELACSGQWISAVKGLLAIVRNSSLSYQQAILRYLVLPLTPVWLMNYCHPGLRKPDQHMNSIFNSAFAKRVGLEERWQASTLLNMAPAISGRAHHARALSHGALPLLLEARDKAAAANSIEPRYPFYDRTLVEFCLSLPGDQKLDGGWTRIAMRRAMETILPREIQWRNHKTENISHVINRLIVLDNDRLQNLVTRSSSQIDAYVDRSALASAYHRLLSVDTSGSLMRYWSDAEALWKSAVLDLWLENAGFTP